MFPEVAAVILTIVLVGDFVVEMKKWWEKRVGIIGKGSRWLGDEVGHICKRNVDDQ